MRTIENGNFVKICYTAKLENGEVFDRSESCQPIEIHVGSGEMIQGVESALLGMGLNEKKTVTISPEEGYGDRDDRLERVILRSNFPPDYEPKAGEFIAFKTPKGEQLPARIVKVEGENITVDFNHPLAGQQLTYEIEVADISDQPGSSSSTASAGCPCSMAKGTIH